MPSYSLYDNKRLLVSCLLILFISIGLYVFTNNIAFLTIPEIALYLAIFTINWKIAYWVMLFCIPLSLQFSIANGSLSLSVPDEPMMWLCSALIVILLLQQPYRVPVWWLLNPIVIVITLQFVWLLIAVADSKVILLSLKFLLAKTWMLSAFFILPLWIFKDGKDYKTAFLLFLIPVTATVIIISLRHLLLGLSFQDVNSAIYPLYSNHVEYGTILSIFSPLAFVAYSLTKKFSRNRKWMLLAILLLLAALLFSYCRAATLALVFAGVVAMAVRLKLANVILPFFYGLVALACVYMTHNNKYLDFRPNFERTYMHTGFADHMLATFRGTDVSSMERLHRWIAAVRMSKDEPLTGYGPHAFYYYYKPYTSLVFRTYSSKNEEHSTTHNYFLYVLAEQGWPAMLLYALLIIVVFANAQKTYHRFNDKFYKMCTLGLIAAFAACFVNNFFSELIETDKTGALFYLIIALLILLDRKSKEQLNISGNLPETSVQQ